MRKHLVWFVAALVALAVPALAHANRKPQASRGAVAKLQVTQCALKVSGMHCAMCPAMVKARLLKLAGVKAAAVDYKTGRAAVQFEAKDTNPGKIVAEFNRANSGYRVALAKPKAN